MNTERRKRADRYQDGSFAAAVEITEELLTQ